MRSQDLLAMKIYVTYIRYDTQMRKFISGYCWSLWNSVQLVTLI